MKKWLLLCAFGSMSMIFFRGREKSFFLIFLLTFLRDCIFNISQQIFHHLTNDILRVIKINFLDKILCIFMFGDDSQNFSFSYKLLFNNFLLKIFCCDFFGGLFISFVIFKFFQYNPFFFWILQLKIRKICFKFFIDEIWLNKAKRN